LLALLIIPILVSGYIMITTNQYHYFRLYRHDGQLLYMKVAAYGTFCLIASALIAAAVKYIYPDFHLVVDMTKTFKLTSYQQPTGVVAYDTGLSTSSQAKELDNLLKRGIKNKRRRGTPS